MRTAAGIDAPARRLTTGGLFVELFAHACTFVGIGRITPPSGIYSLSGVLHFLGRALKSPQS